MSDIITGIRQLIQDLVMPDLKAIQADQKSIAKQIDALQQSLSKQAELQYTALMAAIEAFRAEMRSEQVLVKAGIQTEISRVAERVSVLEAVSQRGVCFSLAWRLGQPVHLY